MRLFDNLIGSKEERECLNAALQECDFAQQMLNGLLSGFPALAADSVMKQVRMELKTTKADLVTSVRKGLSYRTIIFLLISNHTWAELMTGEHMIYRNVLSMHGEGLRDLFFLASDCLVSTGYHSGAESEAEKAQLLKEIKELG
jgi:hypothetical protein